MNGDIKDSLIVGETNQGGAIQARPLRLTRLSAAFEIFSPDLVLRSSEVLENFRIVHLDRTIYSGRAVVQNLINAGVTLLCEVFLDERGWMDTISPAEPDKGRFISAEYDSFLSDWQKLYRVRPEFKIVVADMQSFLSDLRTWLDRVELSIRSSPSNNRSNLEHEFAAEIAQRVVPNFDEMHERMETLSDNIDQASRAVHQNFLRRQLHPLILCSPFAHRTYHKPLGYAGDYEMISMLARDPFEGSSLFAKVLNCWFVSQWPAKAHRNRLLYLAERLGEETRSAIYKKTRLRALNFACGPAAETQSFLKESNLSDFVDMTLLDFNEETLQHTRKLLSDLKKECGRGMEISLVKRSVSQVLKESNKATIVSSGAKQKYHLIYCAGLLDYLSDRTSKQLIEALYQQLEPGGLLVITTVDDYKHFRNMLEFALDWHLIYRDGPKADLLIPDNIPRDAVRILRDSTGVNVFVELRKPRNV